GKLCVPIRVGDERLERRNLRLRFQHGAVRAIEIVEMLDQIPNTLLDRKGLEHVPAYKFGEIADGFQRHRLIEQLERLLGLDSEAASERSAVRREAQVALDVWRFAQALAQRADIVAEAGKIARNRQRTIGHDVEALRLTLRVAHKEHLRERDVPVVALI